jgi:hypothetical protein
MDNEKPKQTGPRSEAGKAISSRNALKHGVYSKARILPGEDPAELDQLTADYYQHFQPANPPERKLVDDLVHGEWILRRLNRIDTEILEMGMEPNYKGEPRTAGEAFINVSQTELRLQRRIDSTDRLYRRILDQLLQLQKDRSQTIDTAATQVESTLEPAEDFVSSTPENTSRPPKCPRPHAPSGALWAGPLPLTEP